MYTILQTCSNISVDSIELCDSVAKILKVKSGDYVELVYGDKRIILVSRISHEHRRYTIKVSMDIAKLLNLNGRIVRVFKCKYSRNRVLSKVRVEILNYDKPPITLLTYIRYGLIGKPAKTGNTIPVSTPIGPIIVRIIETEPYNASGLIGYNTLITF